MRIFVSYRRSDTQDFAGRLVDRLCEAPGVREVFFDVIGIEPGENFEAKLTDALARCEVCLVLIGANWRGERSDGPAARIEDPGDFVRLEARQALQGQARIIPILANGAVMPAPEDLPEELRELATLNAVSVRHLDFDRDIDHLLDVMFERRRPAGLGAYLARHPFQRTLVRGAAGLAAALVGLLVVAALHFSLTGHSLDQAIGGPGPTILLIAAVLIAGAWAPSLIGRRPPGG